MWGLAGAPTGRGFGSGKREEVSGQVAPPWIEDAPILLVVSWLDCSEPKIPPTIELPFIVARASEAVAMVATSKFDMKLRGW